MNPVTSNTNHRTALVQPPRGTSFASIAVFLLVTTCSAALFAQSATAPSTDHKLTSVSAVHVIGLEGVSNNASGKLSITNDGLNFQKTGGAAVEIKTASITSVSSGQTDKQVGGVPVALGRAATPFGGGRAIALVSHKKYDTLTLEYQDSNGALHGAVFQLAKGQSEVIQNELVSKGVHANETQSKIKASAEGKNENN